MFTRKLFFISLLGIFTLSFISCGKSVNGSTRVVLQNKGSDTLVNVAQAWAENYSLINPNLAVAVSGGGSGTGISAMINGTVDIANSSRSMKEREIDAAKQNGVNPVEHIVGFDALAVYVHPDNPITEISLEQIADIYGENGKTTRWSQLGISMPSQYDEIIRISRQNNSGTYAYFRSAVLGVTGEYKLGSLDMHGSKDVVEQCERTPGAIGYSGVAYATDHVKVVPVVGKSGEPVMPSPFSALNGSYPVARPLFMYTSGQPMGAVKEYLDWILSEQGQKIISEKGYAPVR